MNHYRFLSHHYHQDNLVNLDHHNLQSVLVTSALDFGIHLIYLSDLHTPRKSKMTIESGAFKSDYENMLIKQKVRG